jgi:hypothetical protein
MSYIIWQIARMMALKYITKLIQIGLLSAPIKIVIEADWLCVATLFDNRLL